MKIFKVVRILAGFSLLTVIGIAAGILAFQVFVAANYAVSFVVPYPAAVYMWETYRIGSDSVGGLLLSGSLTMWGWLLSLELSTAVFRKLRLVQ